MFASGKTAAVASAANYIEDVFSTYLYTGNGSTQTITNGIDLAGKGGLVWYKDRTTAYEHQLVDTVRGAGYNLETPNTSAQASRPTALTAFTSTGFTLGSNAAANGSGDNFVSWTFRKQAKFFDVVTFTSDGSGGGTFNHNLGSTPGCVIIKSSSDANSWLVYHRSTGVSKYLELNSTSAEQTGTNWISVSSTSVTVGSGWLGANRSMVAYLFAHDAGGFGLTGTDNVISCGSYTGNGSSTGPVIDLGYEPQWLLIKKADSATTNTGWAMFDNMRGLRNSGGVFLYANSSAAEDSSVNIVSALATGFQPVQSGFLTNGNGSTYIYIAIRRGPMKTPTSGTSVYNAVTRTATNATVNTTAGFPVDLNITQGRGGLRAWWFDKLRGPNLAISSNLTNAEAVRTDQLMSFNQNGVTFGADAGGDVNGGSNTYVDWDFRRAPSFFDEVCYTGTGSATTVTHNLGVAPELMIVKSRGLNNWAVYSASSGATKVQYLDNTTEAFVSSVFWNDTSPTSSVFTVGTSSRTNESSINYVAYLFASCAGVSKVGSYTGTGTTKQIDCGFTGGARFVLIKRTDSTGDWYVWDTARGIVSGNDPYLLLNSTAAEVTNTDYVDTYSAGFEISSTAPAAINASGGTFIFLAIA